MKKIFFLIYSLFIFSNSLAEKITVNIQSGSLSGFPYESEPIVLVKVQILDEEKNKFDKTYEYTNIAETPIGFEVEPGRQIYMIIKVGFKDKDGKKHFWPDPPSGSDSNDPTLNVISPDSDNRIKIVQPLIDTNYSVNVTLTNSDPVEGTIYYIQN